MSSRKRAFRFPVSILTGSTPLNMFKVLKGHRIDLRYYPKFLLTLIVSIIFGIFYIPEQLIYRKKRKTVASDNAPVFIIGFWRSGTTLLHSLLCHDPQAGYVTTYQGVFPNLVLTQKKWLKALTNLILPKDRPFDSYPMDMDFPQEEEFAMMSLHPASFYKFFYFPKDYDHIYDTDLHFERLPAGSRRQWEKKYLNLRNKAMMNTGGKRYISKNPCNIFRIKTLKELFPDARFIFIYRNPYQVVESLYRFVNEVLPGSELQHLEGGLQRESFARLYKDSLQEYISAKDLLSPGNLFEISYEEFRTRPVELIGEIYKKFNIPGFEEALPIMEAYLEQNHPDNRTSPEVPRETCRLVNEYASDIVERLGYNIIELS